MKQEPTPPAPDELPESYEPPDFSRVVNKDALTPEVVALLNKMEYFKK